MAKKKLTITASEKSIELLIKSLKAGAPLHIGLQYANIQATTYYYWVAMYSIALEAKSQDELEKLNAGKYGVSIDQIKELANESAAKKKSEMGAFIEPSAESMLQYRNQTQFKKFADQCYEIVNRCNEARAGAALTHLTSIAKSVNDKRVNASGAMWFLERTLSDYFAKPSDKVKEEEINKMSVEKVQVEFVDPGKPEDKERIKNMEQLILNEQKGIGDS